MRDSFLVGQLGSDPNWPIESDSEAHRAGQNLRKGFTAALALGRWCLFLWRPSLWRSFRQCLYAAPSAGFYALPAVPSPSPCEHCAAPYAASCDWCGGPDAVRWHRCAGPDVVACPRCAGPDVGPGLGPGAVPRQAFEPQHLMLSAPRLAFLCQTPHLLPKLQASFDERSCPLQSFHSCAPP